MLQNQTSITRRTIPQETTKVFDSKQYLHSIMPPTTTQDESKANLQPQTQQSTNKSKKRKQNVNEDTSLQQHTNKKQKKSTPLKGMIIGISTLQNDNSDAKDNINDQHSTKNSSEVSYKMVAEACRIAGARISSQIHKKVNVVLCTKNAVDQLTQRVRKAKKKNIPLVDLSWLEKCQQEGRKVDHEPFLLKAPDTAVAEQNASRAIQQNEEALDTNIEHPPDPNAGWSSPAELGCCCICHEEDWDKCDWCGDSCQQ